MTGLYFDPQGDNIFSTTAASEHGRDTISRGNTFRGDLTLDSARETISTLRKRITELESTVPVVQEVCVRAI